MMYLCLVVSLMAAASGAAPQNKKNRDWLLLLPVQFKADVAEDELSSLRLLVRGQTVNDFETKGIPTVSPVQMGLTEKDLGIKLDELSGWDKGVIDKLVERWKPRYVALLLVEELTSKEGSVGGNPPAPGMVLTTDARVHGWLWDVKTSKFVFECKEGKVQLRVGRPGPSDQQVIDQNRQAVMNASKLVFKEFLGKLPTPRKFGIGTP